MLTLGCLGVAGLWVGLSNQFGPRFIRGLIAETGRGIETRRRHIEVIANASYVRIRIISVDDRIFVRAVAVVGRPNL